MIKQLFSSYKYKYDNLSDNAKQIANLSIFLLILFCTALYIITLHASYTKNIVAINNLAQKQIIVEQLVKNIPPKLNLAQVEQSLKQNNINILSAKWENNLELDIEADYSVFLTWLQSTRFKIKDMSVQRKQNSNKMHITAVLN